MTARHAMAQRQFEMLVSDYRDFTQYRADRMTVEEAEQRFDQLEQQRKRLIETSIEAEPDAPDAGKK
jgi:hypothetical protein